MTDEESLIWKMAEAHWAASMGDGTVPFREIPTIARELYYDSMCAALQQLIPTRGMVDAALRPITARERAAAAVMIRPFPIRNSDRVLLAQKFAAMVDRLLQTHEGTHADT